MFVWASISLAFLFPSDSCTSIDRACRALTLIYQCTTQTHVQTHFKQWKGKRKDTSKHRSKRGYTVRLCVLLTSLVPFPFRSCSVCSSPETKSILIMAALRLRSIYELAQRIGAGPIPRHAFCSSVHGQPGSSMKRGAFHFAPISTRRLRGRGSGRHPVAHCLP